MHRTLVLLAGLAASLAWAEAPVPVPPVPAPLGFASVAAALQALQARDGQGTVVTHADGWTIVNEPQAAAQWSFTPAGHAAHPALVRRVIRRDAGGAVSVQTSQLCEGPPAACQQLLVEFSALDERISQALQARGRAAPRPPAVPQPPAVSRD